MAKGTKGHSISYHSDMYDPSSVGSRVLEATSTNDGSVVSRAEWNRRIHGDYLLFACWRALKIEGKILAKRGKLRFNEFVY